MAVAGPHPRGTLPINDQKHSEKALWDYLSKGLINNAYNLSKILVGVPCFGLQPIEVLGETGSQTERFEGIYSHFFKFCVEMWRGL